MCIDRQKSRKLAVIITKETFYFMGNERKGHECTVCCLKCAHFAEPEQGWRFGRVLAWTGNETLNFTGELRSEMATRYVPGATSIEIPLRDTDEVQ